MPESSTSYSWVPFFVELGRRVGELPASELLQLLRDLQVDGLNDRTQPEGPHDSQLSDVDPFTFFSFLNKFGTAKRLQLLSEVRRRLDLTAAVPTDLHGVPSAQAQSVWLFAYEYLRQPDDIEQLRTLHRQLQQDAVRSPIATPFP